MACTCSVLSTDVLWGTWSTATTLTAVSTLGATWRTWVSTGTTTSNTATAWTRWLGSQDSSTYRLAVTPRPESDEERIARLEQERIAAEQRAERAEAARKAAEEALTRAEALLLKHLDRKQRRDYRKNRAFCVRSPAGRTYRIASGRGYKVQQLNEAQQPLEEYCMDTSEPVPDPDLMLAQKLMIETAEAAFVQAAHKRPARV